MAEKKKKIRTKFRKDVFERDKFACVICGKQDKTLINKHDGDYKSDILDAHHITNRNEMPSGGFVKENGVTLCQERCHILAEEYLQGISQIEEYSPESLYKKIGSTKEEAIVKSKKYL